MLLWVTTLSLFLRLHIINSQAIGPSMTDQPELRVAKAARGDISPPLSPSVFRLYHPSSSLKLHRVQIQ